MAKSGGNFFRLTNRDTENHSINTEVDDETFGTGIPRSRHGLPARSDKTPTFITFSKPFNWGEKEIELSTKETQTNNKRDKQTQTDEQSDEEDSDDEDSDEEDSDEEENDKKPGKNDSNSS